MVRGSVWKRIKTGDECFFLGESTLGQLVSEDRFSAIRNVVQPVMAITVKALVADEGLQNLLVTRAGVNDLLMRGFIGECKALMKGSEQSPPAPSLPQPKSELFVRGFWGFL
jgi:hypothetical protein